LTKCLAPQLAAFPAQSHRAARERLDIVRLEHHRVLLHSGTTMMATYGHERDQQFEITVQVARLAQLALWWTL